jgi:transcriptional regulator with XRE-family HTH domain
VPDQDPQFAKRRLSRRLRVAREAAGKTQKDVVEELVWSNSKVIRLEAGDVGISVTDLRALLQLYGVTDQAEIDELTEMVKVSRLQPWWSKYNRVINPSFAAYLGYETSAIIVRNFESNLVPGLLQTEDYMRALILDTEGNRDQAVTLRLERQRRITEAGTKQFFIMDEAATRRVIGSAEIMRAQLDHLLTMNERPDIEIMVVPFERGIYPLFRSSYVIYEFPDANDDLVAYVESIDGSIVLSEKAPTATQRKPSDYLKEFWGIETEYAEAFSEEFVRKVSPEGH